eukprot:6455160-Amphidinium_carterae.1
MVGKSCTTSCLRRTTSVAMEEVVATQPDEEAEKRVQWTALLVIQAVAVFIAAGFAEIGGGWLVWGAVRESKPWWWAIAGSL